MCRGGRDDCPHRRCTLNTHQKQEANRRRVQNRAIHNSFVNGAKTVYGNATAAALKQLPPRSLYAFYLAMNPEDPRRAQRFARSAPKFPGRQNMIIEDTRDVSSAFGKTVMGNDKKYDPGAIYAVQPAVLAADRELAERLPADKRDARLAALNVRETALNLGLLDGRQRFNQSRELTDDQKRFLARIDGDDLKVIGEVPQRVYDDVFMRHLTECDFTSVDRPLDGGVPLSDSEKGPHRTLEELYKTHHDAHPDGVPLAEGLVLRRTADGFEVYDTELGVSHPATGYQRGIDVVALCPKITDVSLPRNARGREMPTSVGQFSAERSLLDAESGKGVSHRRKLMAAAATAGFASGVPVNAGGDGRDPRRDHAYLVKAGLAVLPEEDYSTRTEGVLLKTIADTAMRTKREQFGGLAEKLGVPITTASKTAKGSPRVPVKRYDGSLDSDTRTAVRRTGILPLWDAGRAVPEVNAAVKLPVSAFENSTAAPRDGIDREFGGKAVKLVNDANRLARNKAHPDRVPTDSHVALLTLEDAFHARKLMPDDEPMTVSAVSTVPRYWDTDKHGDFFDTVLARGSRVDTEGYVRGAMGGSEAAKTRENAARPNQYVVKYLTTSALRDSEDAVVIGDKSRFVVHSVDRNGDVPVVYMVADDYAADLAAASSAQTDS